MRIFDAMRRLGGRGAMRYLRGVASDGLDVATLGACPRRHSPWFSTAYLACEIAKARPMSTLPAHVYRRVAGGREEVPGHPLARLLTTRWNPLVTAREGMRWLVMARDTLGTAWVRVQWSADGMPVALWPVKESCQVETFYSARTGRAYYRLGPGDELNPAGTYQAWEMLAFKSPVSRDRGLSGASLAELSAANVGLSIDLEAFYERLVTNGNHFPGYLETDQALQPQDMERIANELRGTSGVMEAGRVRVFDKGIKYRTVAMTMADMSLVEQQTWVLQQTCRVLSVPPQEVYDLSRATYSNVEQGAIQFAQKTLLPEVSDIECVLGSMLGQVGQGDLYVRFDMSGLLRGSYRDRMEGYRTGVYAGFFTRNEVRRWEEMPPLPGLDEPLQPTAYLGVGPDGEPHEEAAAHGGGLDPRGGDPILSDMRERVRARLAERGDCEASREFARRVLGPYARACALAGVEFDVEAEIEGIAR